MGPQSCSVTPPPSPCSVLQAQPSGSSWTSGRGVGMVPWVRAPGILDPLLLLLLLREEPWAGVLGHLRPWCRTRPQRMRGAERSLVTVGRSFTVAKGFVPLWGIGYGKGGRPPSPPAVCLGRVAGQASAARRPARPIRVTGSHLAGFLRPGTHRGKSSGGCCSQDMSFCTKGGQVQGRKEGGVPPLTPREHRAGRQRP